MERRHPIEGDIELHQSVLPGRLQGNGFVPGRAGERHGGFADPAPERRKSRGSGRNHPDRALTSYGIFQHAALEGLSLCTQRCGFDVRVAVLIRGAALFYHLNALLADIVGRGGTLCLAVPLYCARRRLVVGGGSCTCDQKREDKEQVSHE